MRLVGAASSGTYSVTQGTDASDVSGPWVERPGGYGDDHYVSTGTTSDPAVAHWTFDDLDPGVYRLSVSEFEAEDEAEDDYLTRGVASFVVLDGAYPTAYGQNTQTTLKFFGNLVFSTPTGGILGRHQRSMG